MSIKINRLEEGHNSYPLVCRRPAETVSLLRRQICYRWGTPAYWSLVPRSSMLYLFEFCLKNMWNCSLAQHILSHSSYDWKLCELFLLSGFLICHAVGWYIELNNQRERCWFQVIQKIFRVFQNPHVIYATTRINSFTIFLLSSFTADRIFVRWIDNSFVEQVDDPAMYLSLYGVLWSLGIQYK